MIVKIIFVSMKIPVVSCSCSWKILQIW